MAKFVVSSAILNENSRGVAVGLLRASKLSLFCTTLAFLRGSWLLKLFLFLCREKVLTRALDSDFSGILRIFPKLAIIQKIPFLHCLGLRISANDVCLDFDRRVSHLLDKGALVDANGVYVYADQSYETIRAAKKRGLLIVYELQIAYYKEIQSIISRENKKNNSWVESNHLYSDSDAGTRIDKELSLVEHLVVASSYTKRTLIKYGFGDKKIRVIPYGFPPAFHKDYLPLKGRKLRLLYVGSLGVTKGVRYLLDAVEGLEDKIDLTIVGSGNSSAALQEGILKHRYIESLPHAKVLEYMRESDLFVFPTLSDGFGMVIAEAMSQGTPVVTTPNSCGGDFIHQGYNGWLVPPSDSQAIRRRILEILERPFLIEQVGREAVKTAELRPWSVYGEEIVDFVDSLKK
jgi:glycosyltransferase, family 1